MRKLIALVLVAVTPLVGTGCSTIECGEGTIERDGTCAPADQNPDPTACGPGTSLTAGVCTPILDPAVCDPSTTMEVLDPETGVITCVGTGGGDCSTPLGGCDASAPNTMTACGRIYDIEDDSQLGSGSADTSQCPAGGESTGPCALTITPYNALEFADNPTTTPPLDAASTYLDHCGRFRIRDIQPAGAPFIGLGVEDNAAQPDDHKLTGVAFPTALNIAKGDIVAYTTRDATDAAWGSTSGEGASLAALGVYVNIYRELGMTGDPLSGDTAAGVTILRSSQTIPTDDYYFSDTDTARTTVAPALNVTGANGTGLVLRRTSLAPYSGTPGPLPGGCTWYAPNGKTVATVVFAQIHTPNEPGCDF